MKKKVTLSVEDSVYKRFQEYCDKNAIMLSKKVEIWMEEFLKENSGKKEAGK